MSATTNLGKVSVTPKGAWAITNAYEILDIVTSGGSSYLAKQDVPTGVALSNTSYWIMIAEKGDGGEVTSASASISGGYGTPGVSVTAGGTAHERTLAFAFTNLRGEKGETGNGIDSVYKTGTSGLVDTYTILFTDGSTYEFEVNNGTASIDDTLTKSGWAADAKAVGDTKASIDGFYETMGVGVADNLTPYSEDSGATQSIPFIAQGTGCGNGESVVDTGSYLQLKKKLGNTVAVNQLAKFEAANIPSARNSLTFSYTDGKSYKINGTADATGSASGWFNLSEADGLAGKAGHKLLCIPRLISGAITGNANHGLVGVAGHSFLSAFIDTAVEAGGQIRYSIGWESGTVFNDAIVTFEFHDVSLWYGSNDRIPSDLLSHPENWGRYYAGSLDYAAGYLDSADGTVMRSIGRNVWDEEWEEGSFDWSTGEPSTYSGRIRSKNFCECIPGATYYIRSSNAIEWLLYDNEKNFIKTGSTGNSTFTASANAAYFKICDTQTGTYRNDITISLYYPGESGYDQYYPHSVLAEVDTGSEVLRSAGAVADEKTPDGTITRRVGVVNLGTIDYFYESNYSRISHLIGAEENVKLPDGSDVPNARIIPFKVVSSATGWAGRGGSENLFCIDPTGYLRFYTTQYSNAAAFKTAMSGVYLYYELATPTTEQGTAFAENIPCDDFGSMYWTQTKGIPQGNEIFYPVDYKASIDTLYNRVEGDMSRIVIDDDLADYNTKAEDESKFATKDAVGGTLRQLLAVKAEIDFADTAYADLASATWSNYSTNIYSASVVADAKDPTSDWSTAVAISTKYPITSRNGLTEGTIAIKQGNVLFYSTTVGSVANVPSAMSGVLLAYEKASS